MPDHIRLIYWLYNQISGLKEITNGYNTLAKVSLNPPCIINLTAGLDGGCGCMPTYDQVIQHAEIREIAVP
ncbi:MAG: hypothetical protein P4L50_07205 [Anaerolineaceae bacterium]|nr:hypothetical protein [Anaerolineaceae bacterium]